LPPLTDRSGRHESWFLFNDELVTKIDGLGDRISQKQSHREAAEEDEKWVMSNVVALLLTFLFLEQIISMFRRNAGIQGNGDESKIAMAEMMSSEWWSTGTSTPNIFFQSQENGTSVTLGKVGFHLLC